MNALHEQFVVEARELIHQATDDLIAVEPEKASDERIDRVFRAFHTLKGSAGVVELPPMILTLHAAEDLLAAIRGRRLDVSSPAVDAALACLDQVAQWVDAFEAHGALPVRAGEDAQAMARRLRECGFPVSAVYDVRANAAQELAKEVGAEACRSLARVTEPAVNSVPGDAESDCQLPALVLTQ